MYVSQLYGNFGHGKQLEFATLNRRLSMYCLMMMMITPNSLARHKERAQSEGEEKDKTGDR